MRERRSVCNLSARATAESVPSIFEQAFHRSSPNNLPAMTDAVIPEKIWCNFKSKLRDSIHEYNHLQKIRISMVCGGDGTFNEMNIPYQVKNMTSNP
jgi:hypothetical protein